MRKRGARIKRQARTAPGIVAQSLGNYESGLRMAAEAICGGWASPSNFNDIADTLDLLQLGIALMPSQKADLGAVAVAELALVALQNVRDRHEATGEITADEGEQAAIVLLAETSLDYWNRRSGALFAEAYRQLIKIRKAQRGITWRTPKTEGVPR